MSQLTNNEKEAKTEPAGSASGAAGAQPQPQVLPWQSEIAEAFWTEDRLENAKKAYTILMYGDGTLTLSASAAFDNAKIKLATKVRTKLGEDSKAWKELVTSLKVPGSTRALG